MLNIVYSCNDKIFDGLFLSILSILKRTNENIHFYILTGNLKNINKSYIKISPKHQKYLLGLVKTFNVKNNVTFIDCSNLYIEHLGKNFDIPCFTPYAIFRLFIPLIKSFRGTILYLDVDTLINGDIKLAFDVDISGVEACVCHDYTVCNYGSANKSNEFNSGVMLINVDEIRKTGYFDKALVYLKKYQPKMADQYVLNMFWTKIKTWDDEYRFNCQSGLKSNTIIKHFSYPGLSKISIFNVKPWDIEKVHNILNIHNWDDDYDYFMNEKRKWES